MCGIAGFVAVAPGHGTSQILERMTEAIEHRGPDDSGFYHDEYAHLGHRRLSIIDVAGGHQPLSDQAENLWIVYNGEVFNHAGLREALERAGHRYSTRCDTETILHAYAEHGPRCVDDFRGMFAFAIWDKNARTLFCARDRLGIKPFYYFWDGRVFAFASEIKALLAHPRISAELEEQLLPEYLGFGYVSEERTLFRNIRKLMPGHRLLLTLHGDKPALRIEQYWDLPEQGESGALDEQAWITETRRRLEETVRMRLMSDVPLGVFLSGGVDSSAIAALVRRMSSGQVKTFSVGYAESKFSELDYAAQVARSVGADHNEVRVGDGAVFQCPPRTHLARGRAHYLALQCLALFRIEACRRTGESRADRRRERRNIRWLSALPLESVQSEMGKPLPLAAFSPAVGAAFPACQQPFTARFGAPQRSAIPFSAGKTRSSRSTSTITTAPSPWPTRIDCSHPPPGAVYGNFLRRWNSRPEASPLHRMLYADQKTYLVELLMKQDQMSMAASIESRVPFLDHQFVEFAMRIPDNLKIRGGCQKYILKKAVEDLLPHEIIHRKKMGFPTPLRQWLLDPRAESLYRVLGSPDSFLASCIDRAALRSLLDRHRSGLEDATDRIWSLLNLQIWGDVFITGNGTAGRTVC